MSCYKCGKQSVLLLNIKTGKIICNLCIEKISYKGIKKYWKNFFNDYVIFF